MGTGEWVPNAEAHRWDFYSFARRCVGIELG